MKTRAEDNDHSGRSQRGWQLDRTVNLPLIFAVVTLVGGQAFVMHGKDIELETRLKAVEEAVVQIGELSNKLSRLEGEMSVRNSAAR